MKTPFLKPNAHLALIAPSSPVYEKEKREATLRALKKWGYTVTVYPSVTSARGYLSGSDSLRAADVMDAFLDDGIDGILCLRGGYGAGRILPLLDFSQIKKHPKPFIGYSDATALHLALHRCCGFPTFHGPMGAELPGLKASQRKQWQQVLSGAGEKHIQNTNGDHIQAFGRLTTASGIMLGGNMSVFSSLLGTPYMPDLAGKILLLEDVGERPYRIDRMLNQFKTLGLLNIIKALVLCDFTDCEAADSTRSLNVVDVFKDLLPPHLPVIYGLHIGHGKDNLTLPLGVRYRVDTKKATLTRLDI